MAKKSLKKQRFSKKRSLTKRVQRKLSKKSKKRKTSRKNHKKTTHSRKMKGGSDAVWNKVLVENMRGVCVKQVYNIEIRGGVARYSLKRGSTIVTDQFFSNYKEIYFYYDKTGENYTTWYIG